LKAQRSRQTSYGVELGPLGTFTLRLVMPWFAADGQLLGFVELGMEIDHVLRKVQHIGNAKTYVLINKQFLDRREWEAGMRMLGRLPDWEQFPDAVVNNQAVDDMPKELAHGLHESLLAEKKLAEYMLAGTSAYRAVFLPLMDAAGNSVGRMVLMLDVSVQVKEIKALTRESILVGGIACVSLLGFFYWLLGVVGRRLEQDQLLLHELASRDGLTGLYNHRVYYVRLDEELIRRHRTGTAISVLLLDIDHFKLVNDHYGHLAGDMVLKTLSELVMRSCRAIDIACRYGGEEITVILPETGADGAMEIAERLRRSIEAQHFELGENKSGHITVSIGVSTSSELLSSSKDLTDSADRALYRAKEQGRNRVECAEMPRDIA
jgi:diguanylate cyclase (GGDEF)-like protein